MVVTIANTSKAIAADCGKSRLTIRIIRIANQLIVGSVTDLSPPPGSPPEVRLKPLEA